MTAAGEHLQSVARLEPGDSIPAGASAWLVAGLRVFVQADGSLPLEICLGLRRDDSPQSGKQRRAYYLRRAFAEFQPPKPRINANRILQFSKTVKAFRNTYHQFQRTGRLPRGQFELYLYLAFDSGRVPTSESQLRRIVQQF